MLLVVAGGCGFIGSNFIRLVLAERPDVHVVNLDALTYAGNLANLQDIADDPRYRFLRVDIGERADVDAALAGLQPDAIVNFAAESHVDRSILGPEAFVRTNVNGTLHLLEAARRIAGVRYVQISTDEVYGSLGDDGRFHEEMAVKPSSPYSASKAAADLLVGAWHHTYGLDTLITRCSNNYGPYQFPEKLIPLMILHARSGKPLPVYGNGRNVRDWIHVEDHCRGILRALEQGRAGQTYHFGGEAERANLDIVHTIADTVCGHRDLVRFVQDRPGHDWRYAMDFSKAERELGWTPRIGFDDGLASTVAWYHANEPWWQAVLNQEYRTFHARWYGAR